MFSTPRARSLAVVGALAFVFAWICTTPPAIALINWDNASYILGIGGGTYTWARALPWSSHLGVGQEYLIGVRLARLFGGTVIDGFRLMNAFFFVAAVLVLADTLERLVQDRVVALALTVGWATYWVNLHYHFILEDNILFIAPCAAIVRLCVLRVDEWRARDSIASGALGLLGFLASYQAMPYVATAFWAAIIGPGRPVKRRARDAVLVWASFGATLLAWFIFTWSTTKLTARQVSHQIFLGPVPNFMPKGKALLGYIFDGKSLFETLGNGVAWQWGFSAYNLPWRLPLSDFQLGILATAFQLVLFALCTVWSFRHRRWAPHLLSASLLLLSFLTSLHKDLAVYTGLKRYDYVPLVTVVLAAYFLGEWRVRASRLAVSALVAVCALASVAQVALGLRWVAREKAKFTVPQRWSQHPHPVAMWYGREGQSWFSYYRGVRRAHPDACQYVFSYDELTEGAWNYDVTASLWSELPSHVALATDEMRKKHGVDRLKMPPRLARPSEIKVPACAWISEEAAALLAANPPAK